MTPDIKPNAIDVNTPSLYILVIAKLVEKGWDIYFDNKCSIVREMRRDDPETAC